jgi:hypothetical protein
VGVLMFDITPYQNYIEIDSPIPYITRKKETVMLYPVLTKDANKFVPSYDILRIDKNKIGDVNIIQSSYLQFLLQVVLYDDLFGGADGVKAPHTIFYWKFIRILELCFQLDNISEQFLIKINDKGKFVLFIKDILIDYKDFNNIIQLIMYQNVYGYEDDTDMNPDIKEAIDEYYALVNKGKETVTLERKISIVTAHTGILKKELLLMTYYSFMSLFEAVVDEIDYVVNKNIEANGGKFKQPIEHFVYRDKKSKYSNAFGKKESLEKGFKKI